MAERIIIKSDRQVELMRKAGRLTAQARAYGASLVRPGITTKELDRAMHDFIIKHGGYPSFLHLYGFPGTACISVNDAIIHGIPSKRRLEEGDIVSIDVGACIGFKGIDPKTKLPVGGYHGDCAGTFPVGKIDAEAQRLIDVTEQSFFAALQVAREGYRVSDIGHAVQQYVEERGFAAVRDLCGHGIGREMHEDPGIPNFGAPGHGVRLRRGMTICIEPMINMGSKNVVFEKDGWTVRTKDRKCSAHFEHCIAMAGR